MEFKPTYLADALRQGTPIDLWVKCHGVHWPATDIERELLRQRLGQDARLGRAEPETTIPIRLLAPSPQIAPSPSA
jgi:hypothetical protein